MRHKKTGKGYIGVALTGEDVQANFDRMLQVEPHLKGLSAGEFKREKLVKADTLRAAMREESFMINVNCTMAPSGYNQTHSLYNFFKPYKNGNSKRSIHRGSAGTD